MNDGFKRIDKKFLGKAASKLDVLSKYFTYGKNKFLELEKIFKTNFDKTFKFFENNNKEYRDNLGRLKSVDKTKSEITLKLKLIAGNIRNIFFDIKENVKIELYDYIKITDGFGGTTPPVENLNHLISGLIKDTKMLQPTKAYYLYRIRTTGYNGIKYDGFFSENLLTKNINNSFYNLLGSGLQSEVLKTYYFNHILTRDFVSYNIGMNKEVLIGHTHDKQDWYFNESLIYYNGGTISNDAKFIFRLDSTGLYVRKLSWIDSNDTSKGVNESYFISNTEVLQTLINNGTVIKLFDNTYLTDIYNKDFICKNYGFKGVPNNNSLILEGSYKYIGVDGKLYIDSMQINFDLQNKTLNTISWNIGVYYNLQITDIPIITKPLYIVDPPLVSNPNDRIFLYIGDYALSWYNGIVNAGNWQDMYDVGYRIEYNKITFSNSVDSNSLYIDEILTSIPTISKQYEETDISLQNFGVFYYDNLIQPYYKFKTFISFGTSGSNYCKYFQCVLKGDVKLGIVTDGNGDTVFENYYNSCDNLIITKYMGSTESPVNYNSISDYNTVGNYNNHIYYGNYNFTEHTRFNNGKESILGNYTTISHVSNNNTYKIIEDYYNGNTIKSCKINNVYQIEELNNGFKYLELIVNQDTVNFNGIKYTREECENLDFNKLNFIGLQNLPLKYPDRHYVEIDDIIDLGDNL